MAGVNVYTDSGTLGDSRYERVVGVYGGSDNDTDILQSGPFRHVFGPYCGRRYWKTVRVS